MRAGRCQPLTGGAVPHHKGGSAKLRDEDDFLKCVNYPVAL